MNPFQLKFNYSYIIRSAGNLKLKKYFSIQSSSETIRATSIEKNFDYWLAGLIDGDGSLLISDKGYLSCEITLKDSEIQALYKIKKVYHGSVSQRINARAWRWRLCKFSHIVNLFKNLSDKFVSQSKFEQAMKFSLKLGIPATRALPSLNNAWLAGFMEAEGSFKINSSTYQLDISIGQKDREILDLIVKEFKVGSVYYDKSWNGWIYCVSKLEDLKFLTQYFLKFGFKSASKAAELVTFKRFILFKERNYHLMDPETIFRRRFDNLIKNFHQRKKI